MILQKVCTHYSNKISLKHLVAPVEILSGHCQEVGMFAASCRAKAGWMTCYIYLSESPCEHRVCVFLYCEVKSHCEEADCAIPLGLLEVECSLLELNV